MPDEPTLPPPDPAVTLDPPPAPTGTGSYHPPSFADEPTLPDHVGRYEVRGELGEGTFGVVYRAYDPLLDREVALKVAKASTDIGRRDRFRREAQAVAGLRHPNIVPLFEAGEANGRAYLASAFIPGTTLADALAERERGLPPAEAAALARKLADALAYAHSQGVIHRDVKPANVMLDPAGEPHLLDFGLARRLDDAAARTQDGTVLGTPAYLAPEVCLGDVARWSPAADQYALGVVLYELLTGRPPFEGPTAVVLTLHQVQEPVPPSRVNGAVPRDLEAVCLKCFEKTPGRRYADCAAVADDLRRWADGRPTAARPLSAGERLRRWASRNRALATALTAAAVFLIGGTTTSTVGLVSAAREAKRAEGEANRANEQAGLAAGEAKRANEQAALLAAEKDKLDRTLSRTNYFLAQARHKDGRVAEAAALLDAIRPEDRGIEWGFLRRQINGGYATLRGHNGPVQTVAFSPDGTRLAAGGDDGTVQLWDAVTGAELVRVTHPEYLNSVRSLAFSPDGRRLALAVAHKPLRLLDAATGAIVADFLNAGDVHSVAFSPDGRRIAAGSADVRVWDAESRAELVTLRGHTREVKFVAFSPDGRRLASAGSDNTVRLWDSATGAEIAAFRNHWGFVPSVAFSPDGQRLVSPGDGRRILSSGEDWGNVVRVWDAATGAELPPLPMKIEAGTSLVFSPDGRRLAAGSSDQTVKLWDAATGAELATFRGHTGGVTSVAFSPDGRRLATGSYDQAVKLWDVAAGDVLVACRGWDEAEPVSVAFSPDGRRLATGCWHFDKPGGVKLWDPATGAELATFRVGDPFVNSVAFSPDGRRLAFGARDQTVQLWDVGNVARLATLRGHAGPVRCVAFGPDGRRLASASEDGTVKVWDAVGGAELVTLRGHEKQVYAVAFSPDGRRLATAGGLHGAVKVWGTTPDAVFATLRGHNGGVLIAAFSPDGRRLASGGNDGPVRVWDVATGTELIALGGRIREVHSVVFSPDGRRLAAGLDKDDSAKVVVWDAATGAEIFAHGDLSVYPSSLAFSPDGGRLAAHVGGIKVWDAATGAVVTTVDEYAKSVTFSPDGRRLAGRGENDAVRVWDATKGRRVDGPVDFPVDRAEAGRHGHIRAVIHGDEILLVDTKPDDGELGQRQFHARFNPWWHAEQAEAAAAEDNAFGLRFHTRLLARTTRPFTQERRAKTAHKFTRALPLATLRGFSGGWPGIPFLNDYGWRDAGPTAGDRRLLHALDVALAEPPAP